jgi:hypothetical protein
MMRNVCFPLDINEEKPYAMVQFQTERVRADICMYVYVCLNA